MRHGRSAGRFAGVATGCVAATAVLVCVRAWRAPWIVGFLASTHGLLSSEPDKPHGLRWPHSLVWHDCSV